MVKLLPAAKTNLALDTEPLDSSDRGYRVNDHFGSREGLITRFKAAASAQISTFRNQIGSRLRRARVYTRWIVQEFYQSPRFEIYARRMDAINRRAILSSRGKTIERFEPYVAPTIPNRLLQS